MNSTKKYVWEDADDTIPAKTYRKVQKAWVGRTVFYKSCPAAVLSVPSLAPPPGLEQPAVVDGDAEPLVRDISAVLPGTSDACVLSLSSLRPELKAAERKGPALSQVISYLKKCLAGGHLADPLWEGTKVRARAGKYRLASTESWRVFAKLAERICLSCWRLFTPALRRSLMHPPA